MEAAVRSRTVAAGILVPGAVAREPMLNGRLGTRLGIWYPPLTRFVQPSQKLEYLRQGRRDRPCPPGGFPEVGIFRRRSGPYMALNVCSDSS